MATLKCAKCGKPLTNRKPGEPPFCSERCRLLDLGKWASGEYAIPGEPAPTVSDENWPTDYAGAPDDETLH